MNFKDFMELVEAHVEGLDEHELRKTIVEIARKLDDKDRDKFIFNFQKVSQVNHYDAINEVKRLFLDIEEGELYFKAEWYEIYDHYSHWGADEKTDYADPLALGNMIKNSVELIFTLVNEKNYTEALEWVEKLFDLTFLAYDEGRSEFYELEFIEVISEGLLAIDIDKLRSHHMHCIYQVYKEPDRINKMWDWLTSELYSDFQIEKILSVGPEALKKVDCFMIELNKFLRGQSGKVASRLLNETLIYVDSDPLDVANEVAKDHPSIYVNLIKSADLKEKIRIGQQALEHIPENLMIRSKIATILASINYDEKNKIELKKQLLTMYLSKSTPYNFIQLFIACDNEEIHRAYKENQNIEVVEKKKYFLNEELAINYQTKEWHQIIKLMNGDIEEVLLYCDNEAEYLGWSSNCLGIVFPMVLLLIEDRYINESKAKSKILSFLEERFKIDYKDEILVSFEEAMMKFKENNETDLDKLNLRKWIDKHLIKRAEAVLGGGYTNSYHKVAELVVYYGEVLESLGEDDAKNRTVELYRKMHSRKRRFKEELYELV
jgi:hypothetical protein